MIREQSKIVADLESRSRDTDNARWSAVEAANAVNDALLTWYNKVSVQAIYSLPSFGNTHYYTLPYYVNEFYPQQWVDNRDYDDNEYDENDNNDGQWIDIPGYKVEAASDGTRSLVLPFSCQYDSGRLIMWVKNGPLPVGTFTVSSEISATATSAVIATATTSYDFPAVGWVLIGREWIQYSGVDSSSYPTTITLTNLLRGQEGTTAAVHSAAASVEWGVKVNDAVLFDALQKGARSRLHELFLTDSSPKEMENHRWMMRWYEQQLQAFWRSYVPEKRQKTTLTLRSTAT